jgi:uncharacterized repeat protein (TIGR03847 family)
MEERSHEFHHPDYVMVRALGQPGKRTFYLEVGEGTYAVRLWLEKLQLQMLSDAIRQLLASLSGETSEEPEDRRTTASTRPEEGPFDLEFQVGKLALGYDERRNRLVIYVYTQEATGHAPPSFACWTSRRRLEALADEIDRVCAAGRPMCPLCNQPMDPEGHICPRKNGHFTTANL